MHPTNRVYLFCINISSMIEAHHSSSNGFQKILDYFKPEFWLGMTETPDKRDDSRDDKNIYEIFIVNAINKLRLLLADLHGDDAVIGCARQYK